MKGEWTVTTVAKNIRDKSSEPGLSREVANILEKVAALLEKGRLISKASPLAILITTSLGGVVLKIDATDRVYEFKVPLEPPPESAKVISIFDGTGLACEARLRTKKAPEPRKGVPVPSTSTAVPEVFYILYPSDS